MGAFLPNTTVPDNYPAAPQLGGQSTPYERGQLLIANNPVTLTVFRGSSHASITQDEYAYVTPSLVPLVRGENEYIYGVLVKNAIPGSAAQVSGYLIEPGVAGLGAGSAFTQSVAVGGGVTPGLSSVQIQRNGVLVGTEPILDFIDASPSLGLTVTDDAANTRVVITPNYPVKLIDFIPAVNQATLDTNTILGGNIPQTFSYLEAMLVAESATAAIADQVRCRMNNDATANYIWNLDRGQNNVASSAYTTGDTSWFAGECAGATLANWMSASRITFPWYTSAKIKAFISNGGFASNAAAGADSETIVGNFTGSIAAITRLQFFLSSGANFVANATRLVLYGYP